MKEHQAREYIFETKMMKLLEDSGYVKIHNADVPGRSGDHEIESYATLNLHSAFTYPVRIIGQYKFYAKSKVALSHIRDFTGIMKDICESNFATVGSNKNTPDRFNDVGCYYSASGFTRAAQEYAWAHNIFLMTFDRSVFLVQLFYDIQNFVAGLNENTINNITKNELLEGYARYEEKNGGVGMAPEGAVGIVNGVYPVMLLGTAGWLGKIVDKLNIYGEEVVYTTQVRPYANQFETQYDMTFDDISAEFVLPNVICEKLAQRADNSNVEDVAYTIDLPYLKGKVRKIISIKVRLEKYRQDNVVFEQMKLTDM